MKKRILSILLVLALVLCLAPMALAEGEEAAALPFTVNAKGVELTEIETVEAGYVPYAFDAVANDMVPVDPVTVYVVTVPFSAETVDITFKEERLAYNYMPGNQYLDGALANGGEFEGLSSFTVKIDSNKDGYMDYIQVQTPYDENWNSTTLYAISFRYPAAEFTASLADGELDEPVVVPADYVPYAFDATVNDMVPVDAVPVYYLEIPLDAETVTLTFPEERLAYNYMPGNQYLDGALANGQEFEGVCSFTVKVDANKDGTPDFIQVQTPYDENWNSTTLYAISFRYPDPTDFYALIDGKPLAAPQITKGGYTPYAFDAATSEMVPVDPVVVYTFTVPFDAKTVDLAFGEERLAYNYMPGNQYLDGALANGQEFQGLSTVTVKVDANEDGVMDYIQVQTPYDENWNSTTLYAITFKRAPWYDDAMNWAAEKDLVGEVVPTDPCSRAEIVNYLWKQAGSPKATIDNPFEDVAADNAYLPAILWAVENNITTGMTATTFAPADTCTRAQAVTFLWRASGKPEAAAENVFTDVPAGNWAEKAVVWAIEQGITTGTSATTFTPAQTCSYAHILTFLYRCGK